MPVDAADLTPGKCYRTVINEIRLIRAIRDDQVEFVVLFTAANWTSTGPIQRLPLAQFQTEVENEVPRPS